MKVVSILVVVATCCLLATLGTPVSADKSSNSMAELAGGIRNRAMTTGRRLLQEDKPTEEPAAEEPEPTDEAAEEPAEEAAAEPAEDAAEEPAEDAAEEPAEDAAEPAEETVDADLLLEGETPEDEIMFPPGTACPIDLEADTSAGESMSDYLLTLVTPCSADETTAGDAAKSKDFCTNCVRPLQTFLAREFHLVDLRRTEDDTWDSGDTNIHEKCAMDATAFLQANEMPYDDNFHNSVLMCKNFAEDPVCTHSVDDLLADETIAAAVTNCQDHKDTLVLPTVDGEVTADADEEHPFCTTCYWPFFESIIKKTMSKEFMCSMKDTSDMTDQELEAMVLEDPHMFACLLNIEGKLREEEKQTATIGYTQMEAICFNDLNRPVQNATKPMVLHWMQEEDMQNKLATIEC